MNLGFDRTRRLAAIVVWRAGMDLYPLPDGAETEAAEAFAAEVGGSAANIAVPACTNGLCSGQCNQAFADCDGNKQTNGCEGNGQDTAG